MSAPIPRRLSQRTAFSESSSCDPGSEWPAHWGPVIRPAEPPFPPPERRPTPPGVPSFGSPEALRYSARFLMPDYRPRTPVNLDRGSPADVQRSSSFRDSIARILGHPRPPRDDENSVRGDEHSVRDYEHSVNVNGIGRAEDGTAVQGRFPYRQSGHGMHIGQQLQNHPFHAGNLSVARPHTPDANLDSNPSGLTTEHRPSRPIHLRGRSSSMGDWRTPGSPISYNPPPVFAPQSHNHNLPDSDRLSGTTLLVPYNSPADSSVPRTSTSGNHPSGLRSVSTMVARSSGGGSGGNGGGEDSHTDAPVYPDWFSWVRAEASSLFCCLGGHEERDSPGSPGQGSSHGTNATAQDQTASAGAGSLAGTSPAEPSPAGSSARSPTDSQNENAEVNYLERLHSWLSSVYGTMFHTGTGGTVSPAVTI
ncbi:hypothetical protein N7535_006655 [Penicillium sp. DV-2018c]|nr:hypothetical protein N7535_006655 [Penicillium sp. DV-2018c]